MIASQCISFRDGQRMSNDEQDENKSLISNQFSLKNDL
jgi:hypothetical protein